MLTGKLLNVMREMRKKTDLEPPGFQDDHPRDDGHDGSRKHLLANAVGSAGVKAFNLQHDFFIPIRGLDFPAVELQDNDLLTGKGDLIEQIGQQDRHGAIGTFSPDDTGFDGLELFALVGTHRVERRIGGRTPHDVLRLSTGEKGFDDGKRAIRRRPKEEIALIRVMQQTE